MIDFIDKHLGSIGLVSGLICFILIVMVVLQATREDNNREKIFKECIEDGNKEYVCYNYVHGGYRE